ncbi:hypothetical protein KFL_003940070 [Klebsormidium nitens]|uniref:Cystatin domain-containing protein n=1 Tax=Klebsormidium nitens TaxID=105231 RepID=A0A1Y1IH05_KLENI|nr:hypothetical protein KFL_003940070 [Klebsormidium nitens]|eukprot:GAQ88016.1 hypothetical protein KFL_003940070 [Klebsormidium nitens]
MSAALAAFTVVLAFSSLPQGDAKFARSLKLNRTRTAPAVTFLPGGFAPLNRSEYENPQVQQIVNFTLDAIALKTNHTGFNHTGHDLRFHILFIKTQVVAGINYVLRLTVAARHFKRAYEAEVFKASHAPFIIPFQSN